MARETPLQNVPVMMSMMRMRMMRMVLVVKVKDGVVSQWCLLVSVLRVRARTCNSTHR